MQSMIVNELYDKCGSNSNIPESVSFAEDSWKIIVANVKGNISVYRVGNTKEIALTGSTNGETGSISNTAQPAVETYTALGVVPAFRIR